MTFETTAKAFETGTFPAVDASDRVDSRSKRAVDLAFTVIALPLIAALAIALLILNPVFNPGPLFFRQDRMGQGGQRFRMWKFRTMVPSTAERAFDAPLEEDRIRPLGRVLRRTRLDEIPNFLNVLSGEMSVVGPRPDCWEHAEVYARIVPHYAGRMRVRPGITGLAQVRGGYADCMSSVKRKARLDAIYIERMSGKLDRHIMMCTARVMAFGLGAR